MKFFCWYDNGTGWFEGPYVENHPDQEIARKANDVVGYGAYISETNEDPNRSSQIKSNCKKGDKK